PAAARQEPRPPVEHSPLVAGAPLAGESIPAGPVALQAVVETAVLDAGIPTIGTRREGDPGTPESPVMRPHQPSAIVRGEEPSAGASRGLPGERVVVDGSPAAARQEPRPPVGVAPAVAHAPPLGGSIPSTSLPSGGSAGASSSRDTFSDSQPSRSPAAVTSPAPGLFRDVSTLKENGSLTLVELREFLARLKGRSPQEVIGIVSTSLLIRSLLLATFATAAILAVFTVGPYFVYGPVNQPKVSPAKAAAAAAAELAREQPNKSAPSETANADGSGTPDVERAAKAMGLDETKTADPKKNPLDGPDFDKLLDGK
ncbi:MAG: hypothetical protein NT069_34195, partial [Planctomycetota bacterium]|nr:hypothetical protein [Planctomycetota bacterium]